MRTLEGGGVRDCGSGYSWSSTLLGRMVGSSGVALAILLGSQTTVLGDDRKL